MSRTKQCVILSAIWTGLLVSLFTVNFGNDIEVSAGDNNNTATQASQAQVGNGTKFKVTTVSNFFDKENTLIQAENTTKTVGTVQEAVQLLTAGLNENDGGTSLIITNNTTQVVNNNVAHAVLEKTLKGLADGPDAPTQIFSAGWWGCETYHTPFRCVHVTTSYEQ